MLTTNALFALLFASSALAETETFVTADRVEGPPEETSAFFHDDDGTEQFAYLTTTPVTVTVRRIDGSGWNAADIADAEGKLATCPADGPHWLASTPAGPVLVLTFACSRLY